MQEWKASEKEAQKMTRDGAISVNLVTGEATHISDRPQEQDYSSADETRGASGATPSGRVRRPGTALPPVCSFRRQTGRRRS